MPRRHVTLTMPPLEIVPSVAYAMTLNTSELSWCSQVNQQEALIPA